MNRKIVTIAAFFIIFICLHFQAFGQTVIGARELAMGEAVTALQNTSWAIFGNPAMLSEEHKSVSFYGVQYYGLSELKDVAAAFNYPTKYGVFAAGVHRFGYDLFNRNRLRIGYKKSFMNFHFGAILNYSHVVQGGGYGSAGALGVDVGVAAPITTGLWIGAKATNINQPEYGSRNNEKLSRDLSIGLSYQLSDVALFTAEIYKDVDFPVSYRSGIEVVIIGGLLGRAGITTSPQTFSAGFGYKGSFWSANVAVQQHENQILGYSPAIDFKISW